MGYLLINKKFFQYDMPDRHPESGVLSLMDRDPFISRFGGLAEVRRENYDFCAMMTGFDQEMRIWRTRHKDVGPYGRYHFRFIPIGRFSHIRLFSPNFRGCRRKIAIPVVKRQGNAAHKLHKTRASGITDHRHGGNW